MPAPLLGINIKNKMDRNRPFVPITTLIWTLAKMLAKYAIETMTKLIFRWEVSESITLKNAIRKSVNNGIPINPKLAMPSPAQMPTFAPTGRSK